MAIKWRNVQVSLQPPTTPKFQLFSIALVKGYTKPIFGAQLSKHESATSGTSYLEEETHYLFVWFRPLQLVHSCGPPISKSIQVPSYKNRRIVIYPHYASFSSIWRPDDSTKRASTGQVERATPFKSLSKTLETPLKLVLTAAHDISM